MTRRTVILLAIAAAVITANAYYIHPIIARVGVEFGVSHAMVGAIPAMNQMALALGILLILPLGDRISNRTLAMVCVGGQTLSLAVMVIASDFWLFTAGSTILGLFTITPYLLPVYASKRVAPDQLGYMTALLAVGAMSGVLLSRTASGVVAEYFGWRSIYGIALFLMTCSFFALFLVMEKREAGAEDDSADRPSYLTLIASLWTLALQYPRTIVSGLIQGISFAIFLVMWLGIGLHVTDDAGGGTDLVGYLAACTALNTLTTPQIGKWVDKVGALKARLFVAFGQMIGVLTLMVTGGVWWYLLLPIVITSIAGPVVDLTGRMTSLDQPPEIRTRLMSVYIALMFVGGGFGSWAGTFAYDTAGWMGTCGLALALSLTAISLSVQQFQSGKKAAS